MRRFVLPLALTGILAASAAPAMAQSGGAEAPGPDAPAAGGPGGGAGYFPNAKAPADPPAKPPERRRAKRAPVKRRQQAAGRRPKGGQPVPLDPAPRPPAAKGHLFPIKGPYVFGGEDGRFGAPRAGGRRSHQGLDIAAAEGTPLVAPRSGVVEVVRYQAAGAGYYVVLDGDGEDRDYVYMHMMAGSVAVSEGQRVKRGARIGQVGNTGVSFGAHLHFEVWVRGGWYTGGQPIDPLPLLRAWAVK